MREKYCTQVAGKISATATSKYNKYIQVRIFIFFFKEICVVHLQLQVPLFYPRIMSALWRETFTTSQRVHFPKGKCQNFHQPQHSISDFGLWGMLLPRLQVPFELKYIYLLQNSATVSNLCRATMNTDSKQLGTHYLSQFRPQSPH